MVLNFDTKYATKLAEEKVRETVRLKYAELNKRSILHYYLKILVGTESA